MQVITLRKGKEKKYEVCELLQIGDEWEIELEHEMYSVDRESLFEGLNIQPSMVPIIVNYSRAFNVPFTDD